MIKNKEPTPYDGFDIVSFVNRIRQENLDAKEKKLPEPHPLYKTFIPLEWLKEKKRWFIVTDVSKCLRWAGYKVLGETGIPMTLEDDRKREKGTQDHYRLEREFRLVSLAKEIVIFDPDNGIYGKCDELDRNYITGELFVVDFKTSEQWYFQSKIKREGLPKHLKETNFYVPVPDDELQIMLYIRMWRQLIRYPEIPIKFGLVVYENKNNPNQRKACLVEYDENLMAKFFTRLKELNDCLDKGGNIPPYIPKEANVHGFCPYRLKCPRGQEAIQPKIKKRNIPLWKIYELKRRAKHQIPASPPPQLKLFQGGKENGTYQQNCADKENSKTEQVPGNTGLANNRKPVA